MHLIGAPRPDGACRLALVSVEPAAGRRSRHSRTAISAWLDLNHQEFAVLTTALALLGFSVVAAILLMRTRLRAARNELRLRVEIADLQAQADRLRALLFAEPQVLISWAAGDDRPANQRRHRAGGLAGAAQNSPQRILAFGTWLPPEPALQMDHAVDALRESGEGFLLNLTTSTGRAIEAMGRAIGGQAIVRIRELGGLRRELAESNLRYKALQEETELLRDLRRRRALADLGQERKGRVALRQPGLCEGHRGHEHRRCDQPQARTAGDRPARRNEPGAQRQRQLSARLPIVVGGERRTFDVHALKLNGGSGGIAIDAGEVAGLHAALTRMTEAHRRTLDQLSSGVAVFDAQRRLAFYNESYRRLWGLDQAFLDFQSG